MTKDANRCRWLTLAVALKGFAMPSGRTQSQAHIRPLHWYVACRLVVEGGFLPEEVTPRPPFEVQKQSLRDKRLVLTHKPNTGGAGELTILGGLKTKDVDVVVTKPQIGPCIAVSVKGTLNAFRNLTNRMEEAIGDCANLHISYPNLVYGFLHVLRANREGPRAAADAAFLQADREGKVVANDISLRPDGRPTDSIVRYHDVLLGLAGRDGIRADITRYESLAVALVSPDALSILDAWPADDSPLRIEKFFERLYREYDQRYVFVAPKLERRTARAIWHPDSPALVEPLAREFTVRSG